MEQTLLQIVSQITSGERRRDYGRPLANHLRIALNWSLFLQTAITPDKVVWMMIGLKQAREINTSKYDNLVDTAGYAVCLDDMYQQLVDMKWAGNKEQAINVMQNLTVPDIWDLLEEVNKLERNQSVGETT